MGDIVSCPVFPEVYRWRGVHSGGWPNE